MLGVMVHVCACWHYVHEIHKIAAPHLRNAAFRTHLFRQRKALAIGVHAQVHVHHRLPFTNLGMLLKSLMVTHHLTAKLRSKSVEAERALSCSLWYIQCASSALQ